jgi:hypothetical protein
MKRAPSLEAETRRRTLLKRGSHALPREDRNGSARRSVQERRLRNFLHRVPPPSDARHAPPEP